MLSPPRFFTCTLLAVALPFILLAPGIGTFPPLLHLHSSCTFHLHSFHLLPSPVWLLLSSLRGSVHSPHRFFTCTLLAVALPFILLAPGIGTFPPLLHLHSSCTFHLHSFHLLPSPVWLLLSSLRGSLLSPLRYFLCPRFPSPLALVLHSSFAFFLHLPLEFASSLRGSLRSSLRFFIRSPIPFPTCKRTSESAGCCIRCQRPHAGGLPKAQDAVYVTNGPPHEDSRKRRMLHPMPAASRKRTSESVGCCIPPFASSSLWGSVLSPHRSFPCTG